MQKIEHNSDRDSHPLIYVDHSASAVMGQEPGCPLRPALSASGPVDTRASGPVDTRASVGSLSGGGLPSDGLPSRGETAAAVASRPCGDEPDAPFRAGADGTVADRRVTEVWRQWLQALAYDPEAALAAAQAYQRLSDQDREEWLGALESDAAALGVPRVAIYAPLLAVESEPHRLRRIMDGVAVCDREHIRTAQARAMTGRLSMGARLAVLVEPLYLDFVQVLACGYVPGQRFLWVRHDPIAANGRVFGPGYELDGVRLDASPVKVVIDDLARTIIGHQRSGGTLPEALCSFADLFGLDRLAVGVDACEWGSE